MPFAPGVRLGFYEILAAIGAGGMGEVYRAHDTRLGRDVAIKVLPDAFTEDPERIARFQREARALASLNHPHIAGIYGLEEADGIKALVLELVEGPTLADRIAQGPIPIDEALPIGGQIADALEAAHDQGIIHRDLKPANIKVRADGTVKVLDFGLAKAMEETPGSRLQASGLSMSPTITSPVMTGGGVILGTAAYMSPEQARAKGVDKRSDVWAFGCVLYEMLTGRRAFDADDVTDVLAFIITKEPDLAALPANTPPAIRRLLTRCLNKDRKKRLADISDARLEIEDAVATPSTDASPTTNGGGPSLRRALGLIAAGVLVGGALTGAAVWSALRTEPEPPQPIQRLTVQIPPSSVYLGGNGGQLAVSRDGTRLVYPALDGNQIGRRVLYLRDLAQLEPQPIRGSEGAFSPFFSPDGNWVAFFTDPGSVTGKLKKVRVGGGPPITLCDASSPQGGSWADDGTIVFGAADSATSIGGLFKVSDAGGPSVPMTKPDGKTVVRHGWPAVLPNGKGILMSVLPRGSNYDSARIDVHSPADGLTHTIIPAAYHAHYVSSGHIVYVASQGVPTTGDLMAVPFDIERLRTTGPPVPLIENIDVGSRNIGDAGFGVSRTGVLAYAPNTASRAAGRTLVWVDRQGREEALAAPQRSYVYARLSPDGTRVALDVRDEQSDIWVWNLARQALTRVTTDAGTERFPVWSVDGQRIVFGSPRGGSVDNVFSQMADGSGEPQRLLQSDIAQSPQTFTIDGSQLVIRDGGIGAGGLKLLSLIGKSVLMPLIEPPANERNAEMSPDGRWLAYQLDESGRQEIYVRPFPNVNSARVQISTGGGSRPVWSRNGRELFYLTGSSPGPISMMSVAVQPEGGTITAGKPQKLFDGPYFAGATMVARTYDVSLDGRRFLMIKDQSAVDQSSAPGVFVVVLNLLDELKHIAPSRPNP